MLNGTRSLPGCGNRPVAVRSISAVTCCTLLAVLFLWQSLDGRLYWHEVRFLYASTRFSMGELLSGAFNPHQLGGSIDEVGAGGFYLAKALHLWLLKGLFTHVDPAGGGLALASWISVFLMGCTMIMATSVMKRLVGKPIDPILCVCCMAMAPVVPYLAGKTLSETTALFFVAMSLYAFTVVLKRRSTMFILSSLLCGIILALAGLCRLDMTIAFFGFLAAAILIHPGNSDTKKTILAGAVVVIFACSAYLSILSLFGLDPYLLIRYLRNFYSLDVKSAVMSLFGILSFGGAVYFFSFYALLSGRNKAVFFFLTWFVFTFAPMAIITQNYMVEPRYLTSSLIPLCGMGAIGLKGIETRLNGRCRKNAIFVLVGVVMLANTFVIKLMPYELNKHAMMAAVNRIYEKAENAFILVPWAYTDYHFLSIMAKDSKIYNVNAPGGKLSSVGSEWQRRNREWYGRAYIDSEAELQRLLSSGTCYYLGWGIYPPLEDLSSLAGRFGLKKLEKTITSLPFKNHLAESWIWHSPDYSLVYEGKSGQYRYYRLLSKAG